MGIAIPGSGPLNVKRDLGSFASHPAAIGKIAGAKLGIAAPKIKLAKGGEVQHFAAGGGGGVNAFGGSPGGANTDILGTMFQPINPNGGIPNADINFIRSPQLQMGRGPGTPPPAPKVAQEPSVMQDIVQTGAGINGIMGAGKGINSIYQGSALQNGIGALTNSAAGFSPQAAMATGINAQGENLLAGTNSLAPGMTQNALFSQAAAGIPASAAGAGSMAGTMPFDASAFNSALAANSGNLVAGTSAAAPLGAAITSSNLAPLAGSGIAAGTAGGVGADIAASSAAAAAAADAATLASSAGLGTAAATAAGSGGFFDGLAALGAMFLADGGAIPHYDNGGAADLANMLLRRKAGETLHTSGLLNSAGPGRTDTINTNVPAGAYVIPADVVSGLGEGNTLAGSAVIDRMFSSQPHGIQARPIKHGRGPVERSGPAPINPDNEPASVDTHFINTAGTYAKGGKADGIAPVVVAGGEVVLSPQQIIAKFGSLKRGHQTLDHWMVHERRKIAKEMLALPNPVGSNVRGVKK